MISRRKSSNKISQPNQTSYKLKANQAKEQIEKGHTVGPRSRDDRINRGGHGGIPRKESTDTPVSPGFRERCSRGGARVGEIGRRPLKDTFPTGLTDKARCHGYVASSPFGHDQRGRVRSAPVVTFHSRPEELVVLQLGPLQVILQYARLRCRAGNSRV